MGIRAASGAILPLIFAAPALAAPGPAAGPMPPLWPWLAALAGLLLIWWAAARLRPGLAPRLGPGLVEALCLLGALAVVAANLAPQFWLLNTATTGGDTGSHMQTAAIVAARPWQLLSPPMWVHANLCGYPLFQLYFPLPFALIAALAQAVPVNIAFKLINAACALALPVGAWAGFRLARLPSPAPALAPAAVLPFLFHDANTMWGGNLPSLLSGEFCFSLSLALTLVFLGALARDINDRRHPLTLGALLALVGLTHGVTLVFAIAAGGLHLFGRRAPARAIYLLKVYATAFCLMAPWLVPLLAYAPYSTQHSSLWRIASWWELLPAMMLPVMALGPLHLLLRGRRGVLPALYFGGMAALAACLFLLAPLLNVFDIRYVPFVWLALCLWGAAGVGELCRDAAGRALAGPAALALAALAVALWPGPSAGWAAWNYRGSQMAPAANDLAVVVRGLTGNLSSPRAAVEHSPLLEPMGTTRALENLPLWAGRPVLQGLYLESSLSSPAIYYLQSLFSRQPSRPLPGYTFGRFDLDRALERLRLFNAGYFVAVDPKTVAAAKKQDGLRLAFSAGICTVFSVEGGAGRYAVVPRFRPVLVVTGRPKRLAQRWLRLGDLAVPLVFKRRAEPGDEERFAAVWRDRLGRAPRIPQAGAQPVSEELAPGRVTIRTASPGPLWIKLSYHPAWRVRGARRVYWAAPYFMMVFPKDKVVELRFAPGPPAWLGRGLFATVLLAFLLCAPGVRSLGASRRLRAGLLWPLGRLQAGLEAVCARPLAWLAGRRWPGVAAALFVCLALAAFLAAGGRDDAGKAFERATRQWQAGHMAAARDAFRRVAVGWPDSREAPSASLHWGLSLMNLGRPAEALAPLGLVLRRWPDSPPAPRAMYHLALAHRRLGQIRQARRVLAALIKAYPDDPHAAGARKALKALGGR